MASLLFIFYNIRYNVRKSSMESVETPRHEDPWRTPYTFADGWYDLWYTLL